MAVAEFEIQRAERRQARLRFAIGAASNGGKTWTGLEIAFGLVEELIARGILGGTLEGKVGVVDTERKSAHLYSHLGPYDVIDLGPPYSVERYVAALQQFERAGVAVIMLDSISHAWMGAGGVLALLDRFEDRERFTQFGKTLNPAQDGFVDAILRSPCHVICTMRSKTAWVLEGKEKNGRTVMVPKRIGMAPIQRPGIEYEFTTMVDLDTDTHLARVVKNRCPVFKDWAPKVLTREHGRALASWLLEGAPEAAPVDTSTALERAQASAAASVRAIERAENMPDLARVLEDGDRKIKGFSPAVPDAELMKLRRALAGAKDLRKSVLGRPEPAAGGTVSPEVALELESLLQGAKAPIHECTAHFGVLRLMLLPAVRLQEVVDWVLAKYSGDRPALTKALLAAGVVVQAKAKAGRFDDMEDDLPWVDEKREA